LGTKRFKARGELLSFATKYPGVLAGHFMCTVYERIHNRLPKDVKELRRTSISAWAQKYGGLTEVRDQREVATIAQAMDLISKGDLQEVMDLLSQRILSVQQAKAKGGSWEKASNIELVAKDGTGSVPSGMHRLLA
jgi:hypothetical protein